MPSRGSATVASSSPRVRATLSDFGRQVGIPGSSRDHKYRNILSQVLVDSFFLQIFALISPLFSQMLVDKVLAHRGMATLNVLLIGLIIVSIFRDNSRGLAHVCLLVKKRP